LQGDLRRRANTKGCGTGVGWGVLDVESEKGEVLGFVVCVEDFEEALTVFPFIPGEVEQVLWVGEAVVLLWGEVTGEGESGQITLWVFWLALGREVSQKSARTTGAGAGRQGEGLDGHEGLEDGVGGDGSMVG
jgi:hypothetical protein